MEDQTKEESFWQQIKKRGISFSLVDGKLMAWPEEKLTPELIEGIRRNKNEILSCQKTKYFPKQYRGKSSKSLTFAEIDEIDMPELQIVGSEVWINFNNSSDSTSTENVTKEELNEKILLTKKVLQEGFGKNFIPFRIIQLNKEPSIKTNEQEVEGYFKHQKETARFYRYFCQAGNEVVGNIYISKNTEVPEKIILEYKDDKEISVKTTGKEAQGHFSYQQAIFSYHRFSFQAGGDIVGYLYAPKNSQIPGKIILMYKCTDNNNGETGTCADSTESEENTKGRLNLFSGDL